MTLEPPFVIVRAKTPSGPLVVLELTFEALLQMQDDCRDTLSRAMDGDAQARALVESILEDAAETHAGSPTHVRSFVCTYLLEKELRRERARRSAAPPPPESSPSPAATQPADAANAAPPPQAAPAGSPACGREHAPGVACALCERARFKRRDARASSRAAP